VASYRWVQEQREGSDVKRRTLVAVAGGAAVVGLAAGVTAIFGKSADERPENVVSTHSTQDPHDVATYWTDERMRNAKPG
jgi:Zn-dependent M28 family amino/carboxypeptidase